MKFLVAFLFIFNLSFSQNESDYKYNTSGASKTTITDNCFDVKNYAEADIKNNTIFIFLQGGIDPIIYSTDKEFEKKHNIHFNDLGCIVSKCAETYNHYIFDHLYKTFGEKWMKTIRKDTLGFKSWKKNNKKQHNE
jgi:hypothetical protein